MRTSFCLSFIITILLSVGACAPSKENFLATYQAPAAATPTTPETPVTPVTPVTGNTLVITGSTANHVVVASYDLDAETMIGTYIADFRGEGDSPRGLAAFDTTHFLLAAETSDTIYKVGLDGTKTVFHATSNLAGNLFDLAVGPLGYFYAIETNNIEVFDRDGVRLGGSLIGTTTGACTLNTPRSMTVDSTGQLIVTNTVGTDQMLFYNINTDVPTCVRAVTIGNDPVGIKAHSDGKIYIGTQLNNRIVRTDADGANLTTIWATNAAIISAPSAIAEMPNGDLLVASSGTNTIERITTAGVRVGSNPFIRDALSLTVTDMIIIKKVDGSEYY